MPGRVAGKVAFIPGRAAGRHIRVNSVHPTGVRTAMADGLHQSRYVTGLEMGVEAGNTIR